MHVGTPAMRPRENETMLLPASICGGLVSAICDRRGSGGHPPTLASEHREGCSIQRSSASGTKLRWPRHSQQIETSSCHVDDFSQPSPETLAKRETPMPMARRMLVERRDDVSLPGMALQRNRDRQELWWHHHGQSLGSHSSSLKHSKLALFYIGKT